MSTIYESLATHDVRPEVHTNLAKHLEQVWTSIGGLSRPVLRGNINIADHHVGLWLVVSPDARELLLTPVRREQLKSIMNEAKIALNNLYKVDPVMANVLAICQNAECLPDEVVVSPAHEATFNDILNRLESQLPPGGIEIEEITVGAQATATTQNEVLL